MKFAVVLNAGPKYSGGFAFPEDTLVFGRVMICETQFLKAFFPLYTLTLRRELDSGVERGFPRVVIFSLFLLIVSRLFVYQAGGG